MKKRTIIIIILSILILLFIEKCSLINLSTNDIFRPNEFKNLNELLGKVESENYEIIPVEGDFPILFDSIKNEFYLKNKQGLTKMDAQGNVLFSDNLLAEKYTSVFDFANFTPYVFTEKGVYDFSGSQLNYSILLEILNTNNELSDADFKEIFEEKYKNAEVVIYETDRNIDFEKECFPMYFKIKNEWSLLFCQKDDSRFTHLSTSKDYGDIIGQIDFENNPAKFNNKRLVVLKNVKNGIYSTGTISQKIDDAYLDMYYTVILKERQLDYTTTNHVEIVSYKKDGYHFTGSYWNLPDWVFPNFLNTAYFQITYNDEKLFLKGKAIKYYGDEIKNDLHLYEIPKKFRIGIETAFLDYNPNLGSFKYMNSGIQEPNVKNTGLYIIRQKK